MTNEGMSAQKAAQNIMDEACLPIGLYENGVVQSIQDSIVQAIRDAENAAYERANAVIQDWFRVFGKADPQYISARTFAHDALHDISEVILSLKHTDTQP